ncbi:calcium:proton antiporter [Bosea sp. Root483D1]|uniref:calcium:proton antiporter n=1 Tax=Bosea sp. Root483D1 TaxID=1736544 RepID=UPI0007092726|nr:calcium:proton antiporter [Bosea sp. Root483D1]KRE20777.1 calcium:proton antiporter [Bosea sp. Root483D1]
MMIARLACAWASVAAFQLFGGTLMAQIGAPLPSLLIFAWLLGIIVWSAFGVVHEAEEIAHRLGEPYGTLILTLAIVIIEVALISAVMLGAKGAPTLGRDTMFAVLMIVLNGVVGIGLLIGGLRHFSQGYNLKGASAYLVVIIPLTLVPLVLPNFTTSTADGTLTTVQSIAFSLFSLLLYGVFLLLQTGRHSVFFMEPASEANVPYGAAYARARMQPKPEAEAALQPASASEPSHAPSGGSTRTHVLLLLANILPIVILAKSLAVMLDYGIVRLGAPAALGGILIAMVVFTPECIAALRAITANQLQRAVNLCLGAAASTLGLTVPAVLLIGVITDEKVVLGLSSTNMVILSMTLFLSTLTFTGTRTTMLEGAVHLSVFFVFVVLVFSP